MLGGIIGLERKFRKRMEGIRKKKIVEVGEEKLVVF